MAVSPVHPLKRVEPAGGVLLKRCAVQVISPRNGDGLPSLTAGVACAAQGWPECFGSLWDACAASY